MMEEIKACEKRITKYLSIPLRTINENPSEKIMELALAINEDICIVNKIWSRLIAGSRTCRKIESLNPSTSLNLPAILRKKNSRKKWGMSRKKNKSQSRQPNPKMFLKNFSKSQSRKLSQRSKSTSSILHASPNRQFPSTIITACSISHSNLQSHQQNNKKVWIFLTCWAQAISQTNLKPTIISATTTDTHNLWTHIPQIRRSTTMGSRWSIRTKATITQTWASAAATSKHKM